MLDAVGQGLEHHEIDVGQAAFGGAQGSADPGKEIPAERSDGDWSGRYVVDMKSKTTCGAGTSGHIGGLPGHAIFYACGTQSG